MSILQHPAVVYIVMLFTILGYSNLYAEQLAIPLQLFEVSGDCQPRSLSTTMMFLPELRINSHYIAEAEPGQGYTQWLAALENYRQRVRNGDFYPIIDVDFKGVEASMSLSGAVALALDIQPSQVLHVGVDTRWVSGANDLCVSFDVHSRSDNSKVGSLGVCATIPIPTDSQWHHVTADVNTPTFDSGNFWLKIVFGMDGNYDSTESEIEIFSFDLSVDNVAQMNLFESSIEAEITPLDRGIYDQPQLQWTSEIFACHFTFMYDSSFYDPNTGQYTLDAFLDDGINEFGGYDAIMLWQAYPQIGIDERNQYDFYRNMPGGLAGLYNLVTQAHNRGVKVFISYNPWDTGTRSEGKTYDQSLAEMIIAIDADGIFLDTMSAGSSNLRQTIDAAKQGVAFIPEGHIAIDQMAISNNSWAQYLSNYYPPGLLHLKWIEPRHIQYHNRRWNSSHQEEIESAFFNGSGMLIWENIFGSYNPSSIEDRWTWRQAAGILHNFADFFTNDEWKPFYPTLSANLYAHRWSDNDANIFTLLNYGQSIENAPLLEFQADANMVYYDLWNGDILQTQVAGPNVSVLGSIDRLGCILAIKDYDVNQVLLDIIDSQHQLSNQQVPAEDVRNTVLSVVDADPVTKTSLQPCDSPPPGMVFVPSTEITMNIEHRIRECGCYPDPGTPPEQWYLFLTGKSWPTSQTITHNIGPVQVDSFFIDEAEVTNSDFNDFLNATGYTPTHPENFLKHWPGGQMPAGLADHPVVYVDVDDARAYASWAGKRLPTEAEWHLAAQGTDGRIWPWGNNFDPSRVNSTGNSTMSVQSCPTGRSPYGCYHMSGNVWEWTESCRYDGHTRFIMIRGGSYFNTQGSGWYFDGGPQPCQHHAKFIRMWPGLDRSATIGFRCVMDATSVEADLNDNYRVDLLDFALLGAGWQNPYDMTDLIEMSVDWLIDCNSI